MAVVKAVHLTRLGGFVGSHPEIIAAFPRKSTEELSEELIIENSLPLGINPNTFSLVKVENEVYFLSYIFAVSNKEKIQNRKDLASISVVIDQKETNIEDFKILFEHIVEIIIKQEEVEITTEFLIQSLERIYEGINKMQKVKVGNKTLDIPGIIKKKKLKPVVKKQVRGRIL